MMTLAAHAKFYDKRIFHHKVLQIRFWQYILKSGTIYSFYSNTRIRGSVLRLFSKYIMFLFNSLKLCFLSVSHVFQVYILLLIMTCGSEDGQE